MTYQRDPDPQNPRRYSLREDGGSVVAPVLVAGALIVFIGYLLLGPAIEPTEMQQPSPARVEQPSSPGMAPSPAPAKPQ